MQVQIRRVLCPVDYSEFSRRALDHATALARWYDAELYVLHVVPLVIPATVAAPATAVIPVELEPDGAAAEAELQAFIKPAVDAGVPMTPVIRSGSVIAGIADSAGEKQADLIVIGTHGRSGFERLFLGSTAERVLRTAPCPVLTVPLRAESLPPEEVLFTRILCPIDFSEASLGALEYALVLARASFGRMVLLHSIEVLEDEPWVPSSFSVPEYRLVRQQHAEQALKQLVPEDASMWCEPETRVATGKAYRAILHLAEEVQPDLIVMGAQGSNALDRMLLGSTTHHVVRAAPCPVLTVRSMGSHAAPQSTATAMGGVTP